VSCAGQAAAVICESQAYLEIPKGRKLMKVNLFLLWFLVFAGQAYAQTSETAQKDDARSSARPAKDIVPLPSVKSLTPSQVSGKKLFVQRCSVCHLPALPSYSTYGPVLSGDLIIVLGDTFVREQIMRGTNRMPGYQYTLTSTEIDQIIGYLKTLELTKKD
jgi:mono/diheme cytochrome c family protein